MSSGDRVTNVQEKISQVRARLHALHGGAQHESSALSSIGMEAPTPYAAVRPAQRSAHLVDASPPPVHRSIATDQRSTAQPLPIVVQFSPEADKIAQQQLRRIQDQDRHIATLQAQLEDIRKRQEAASVARHGRVVEAPLDYSGLRPRDVHLHQSPGVSASGRHVYNRPPADGDEVAPTSLSFSEMQALLRAKLRGESTTPRRATAAEPPHPPSSADAAAVQRPPGSESFYAEANATNTIQSHSHAPPAAAPAPIPHEPTPSGRDDTARGTASEERFDVGPPREPRLQSHESSSTSSARYRYDGEPHLSGASSFPTNRHEHEQMRASQEPHPRQTGGQWTSLSGAEVFAVLRLRGIITSQGITGEHLLPTTHCHSMQLTTSEYAQLMQLRELLAAADASMAKEQQRGLGGTPSTPRRSKSPSAAQSAFEKHRQRMQAVRESRERRSSSALLSSSGMVQ